MSTNKNQKNVDCKNIVTIITRQTNWEAEALSILIFHRCIGLLMYLYVCYYDHSWLREINSFLEMNCVIGTIFMFENLRNVRKTMIPYGANV